MEDCFLVNKTIEFTKIDGILHILHIEKRPNGDEKIISIQQFKPTFTKKGLLDKFTNDKIKECFKFLEVEYVQL